MPEDVTPAARTGIAAAGPIGKKLYERETGIVLLRGIDVVHGTISPYLQTEGTPCRVRLADRNWMGTATSM